MAQCLSPGPFALVAVWRDGESRPGSGDVGAKTLPYIAPFLFNFMMVSPFSTLASLYPLIQCLIKALENVTDPLFVLQSA